ncbi:mitochondrial inner membrane protease subunit 2 [Halyomorpha halys]|uniref:mitochondrial inner membrane protease subunit 2 n=1 Tax=Halyomorpha halys TaxID=286706 RepID=UPI0006D50F43|nr:mitochondrial inner membrane protease subunit 2 [Halyomorpha halys]
MAFSDIFRTVLFGIPVGITIIDVFGYVARVDGVSMQPALNPESNTDYVFLNKLSVRLYQVSRGDVVALFSPKDPEQKLIKRIIGLEGDVIKTLNYKAPTVTVPAGHCWVEGDNANNSMDSNLFGPIALALITAKATAIVWPPKRWQSVKSDIPKSRKISLQLEN